MSRVSFTTHRYMFRNYSFTFTSEEAITEILELNISSAAAARATSSTALKMERDMAKALIQQFLWTRLIESAVEPHNRTYRDKGLWRLKSKGLCVLQDQCRHNVTLDLLQRFKDSVDSSTVEPMFLIQIERLEENDRMNCNRKYITCLFAIMIASLPLRNSTSNKDNSLAPTIQQYPNRMPSNFNPIGFSSPDYIKKVSTISNRSFVYNENSLSRQHSIRSADTALTSSTTASREGKSIPDFFPHIKILPNDLLIPVSPNQKALDSILFQQQKALLHNLSPSSNNKFKMRSVFPSEICCTWLIESCTVASNDEAESIMTEFLNLGWIKFYDEKHKNNEIVESSKSIVLKLTGTGMKIVIDVSLEQHTDFQQSQQRKESVISNLDKRCSVLSSSCFSNYTISSTSSSIHSNFEEPLITTRPTFHPLRNIIPVKSDDYFSPIHSTPHQHHIYDAGYTNYDGNNLTATTTPYTESITKLHYNSISAANYSHNYPLTPPASSGEHTKETNSIKLKAILKDTKLRGYFRNFLDINFCVENLDFWVDHTHLCRNHQNEPAVLAIMSPLKQQQLLQEAYILWDTYLCPGASRELNIDHTLREDMAEEISQMVTLITAGNGNNVMNKVIFSTQSTYESVLTLLNWFDKVNDQICKLMTTDSVPKFIRTSEYKNATRVQEGKNNSSDLVDDFPPPPQRKLKETIFL